MGLLADAVLGDKVVNPRAVLPKILAAMPADDAAELESLLADPQVSVPKIRRQVMRLFPDAPQATVSAWQQWAKERRS